MVSDQKHIKDASYAQLKEAFGFNNTRQKAQLFFKASWSRNSLFSKVVWFVKKKKNLLTKPQNNHIADPGSAVSNSTCVSACFVFYPHTLAAPSAKVLA